MKTAILTFILIKFIIAKENLTQKLVETEDLDIHYRHEITRTRSSFDDIGAAIESDRTAENNQTLEILEESPVQINEDDPGSSTKSSIAGELNLHTTGTTTVFFNQDFTSNDPPSLETQETSNKIIKNTYKVRTATRGYSENTRDTTLSSVSTQSWWLSRLFILRRKTTTKPTITKSTTRTFNIFTETSPLLDYEDTTSTIFANIEETTILPSETYKDHTPSTSTIIVSTSRTLSTSGTSRTLSISRTTRTPSTSSTSKNPLTLSTSRTFKSTSTSSSPRASSASITSSHQISEESNMSSSHLVADLSVSDNKTERETERTIVYKVYKSEKALYFLALIIPCLLLVVVVVACLYLRRRVGSREEHKMYEAGEVEEQRLMKPSLSNTARQSLPNISAEMKEEVHYNSMAELSCSSRGESEDPPHQYSADTTRKRWQSDGADLDDCCRDSLLAEADKWRSEDWERDQSFMTMLARRLEVVDSKAEITEL